MYYSQKYKIQWGLPARTASRMTREFLTKLEFGEMYGHHTLVNIRCDWDFYLNIRNPYSSAVSMWIFNLLFDIKNNRKLKSFHEHLSELDNYNYGYPEALIACRMLEIFNRKPERLIRYENFLDDILSVPIIQDNQVLLEKEINRVKQGKKLWNQDYPVELKKPYYQFYNEEIANMVYRQRKYEFDTFEYDPNSWMTIID